MDPNKLLAKAEKETQGSQGFFTKLTGGASSRMESAAELFVQAANAFRLQKDNLNAGKAFERAAKVQQETAFKDEAANTLIESYKAYRPMYFEDAARVLREAIHQFTLRGQFRRAAQYETDLANLYENELKSTEKAIESYDRAGEWFYEDRAEALSHKALLKAADLSALAGKYDEALTRYERVARQSLNSTLSKWSLKDYFVKALFCYLAIGDVVATSKALQKYVDWEPSFASTREYTFMKDLSEAVKSNDEQAFTDKMWEFDRFSTLDKWKVSMGLKVKEKLKASDDNELL